MGTTPKLAIPYVEPADRLADFPVADKAKADRLEALLANAAPDSGWINGGATGTILVANATNFTLTASFIRVIGSRAHLFFQGTLKVAITVPTTGDVINTTLGTLVAAYRPTTPFWQSLQSSNNGRAVNVAIGGSGNLDLASVAGSANLAVGEVIAATGVFLLN